ncbi:VRR-NUC domain-containing protein [Chloroflexota bacterium]
MPFKEIGIFEYSPTERVLFKSGELWDEWAMMYPRIFDNQDFEQARNQAKNGYHYFEWLAAITLWEKTGYISLVEKYEYKIHKKKQEIVKQLVSPELFNLITNHRVEFNNTQCPDLFVYAPDYSDWYFCEVKGPKDRIREPQRLFFEELSKVSGKAVGLIKFVESI